MIQSELDALDNLSVAAIAGFIHDFDSHDLGTWSDTGLCAGVALSGHDAGAMGAVHIVVHGIVVVVHDIVAVVREFRPAIPHAACNVNVVVIHTRVKDGDDDTIAGVAIGTVVIPYGRSVHLVDMPSVVP